MAVHTVDVSMLVRDQSRPSFPFVGSAKATQPPVLFMNKRHMFFYQPDDPPRFSWETFTSIVFISSNRKGVSFRQNGLISIATYRHDAMGMVYVEKMQLLETDS